MIDQASGSLRMPSQMAWWWRLRPLLNCAWKVVC